MILQLPKIPEELYYNCLEPLKILESKTLKPSKIFGGISFSTNYQLQAHGPFKIIFHQAPWFQKLKVVLYPHPIYQDTGRLVKKLIYYQDQFGNQFTKDEFEEIPLAQENLNLPYIKRNTMFADEEEWWSLNEIKIKLREIQGITLMPQSPGARIYPRKTIKIWKALRINYPDLLLDF